MGLTVAVTDWRAMEAATAHLDPPFAALDVAALDANAADMVRRADPLPIRVASKSVRCRWVLDRVLAMPGFRGIMAYSLREALWLAEVGYRDLLVGYPSVDRTALRSLARSASADRVTVMIDSAEHLGFLRSVLSDGSERPLRLCIDVDASLRIGPLHLGVRRSPLRTAESVARLAADVNHDQRFRLAGLMFYDAQVAGLPDSSAAVRAVKRRSVTDLAERRAEIVQTVRRVADLEFVNGGGTGSLHLMGSDPSLTELAGGSGLYGPTLFDRYRDFTPQPAMVFALATSRRPARRYVTAFGGGYLASGPADKARLPRPTFPRGLRLLGTEGAGEVQTPVRGRAAWRLALGDPIWFRHAKAGELCERFDSVYLVSPDRSGAAEPTPTYRGEGRCFG
jgi:D-serine deaminase-like pyridoxal phosphate-dependent protein